MVALGKARRNDEKFCNLYFSCLDDNDHRISCRLDNFSTNALINRVISLKGGKMEKVDREKFMIEIWKQYNATKDIEFLAKACEEAPFFGQKEMAFEIARILRSVKRK